MKAEQLHLTIRFLGEQDAAIVDALAGEVSRALRDRAPLTMRVRGLGTFGRRVVWGALEPIEDVVALAADVEAAVQRAGLPAADRPFAPHVTLARLKRREGLAPYLRANAGAETPLERWDAVTLYRSELGARGATHTALHRFELRP